MKKLLFLLLFLNSGLLFAQNVSDTNDRQLRKQVVLDRLIIPMENSDSLFVTDHAEDFDFLFKGLDFVEACVFFGDFYQNLGMMDLALNYYTQGLRMCETLNGYDGASFTDQIKQLQSIIDKIKKMSDHIN